MAISSARVYRNSDLDANGNNRNFGNSNRNGRMTQPMVSYVLFLIGANNFKVRMLNEKMAEEYGSQEYSGQQFFADINTRLRDLEEKQRILRDRVVLVSESLVKEKEKGFKGEQELKKIVLMLKEDSERMKDLVRRMAEKIDKTARSEDLMILQRQFDLFRE